VHQVGDQPRLEMVIYTLWDCSVLSWTPCTMEDALKSDTYQLQSLTFFMVWNK